MTSFDDLLTDNGVEANASLYLNARGLRSIPLLARAGGPVMDSDGFKTKVVLPFFAGWTDKDGDQHKIRPEEDPTSVESSMIVTYEDAYMKRASQLADSMKVQANATSILADSQAKLLAVATSQSTPALGNQPTAMQALPAPPLQPAATVAQAGPPQTLPGQGTGSQLPPGQMPGSSAGAGTGGAGPQPTLPAPQVPIYSAVPPPGAAQYPPAGWPVNPSQLGGQGTFGTLPPQPPPPPTRSPTALLPGEWCQRIDAFESSWTPRRKFPAYLLMGAEKFLAAMI